MTGGAAPARPGRSPAARSFGLAARTLGPAAAVLAAGLLLAAWPAGAARIDINTAGVAELTELPGIGERTAEAIIAYRNQNGPFRRSEDLMDVPRIGPKTFEKLKDLITVGGAAGTAAGGSGRRAAPRTGARGGSGVSGPSPETPAVDPGRLLPEGFGAVACWSCRETFYVRDTTASGWCPYCGRQWKRTVEEKK